MDQVSRVSNRLAFFLAILLLAGHMLLALRAMSITSPTVDEVTFIAAGATILQTGDFSAGGNHPILLSLMAGWPLQSMTGLQLPPGMPRPLFSLTSYSDTAWWQHAVDFFDINREQVDAITFRARLPFVLLSVLLGTAVFWWSRALYGNTAALLALLLTCLSPNILGNATIAMLDLGFTLLTFVTLYWFWRLIKTPRPGYVVAAGLSLGLTMASKVNAPIAAIVLALLFVVVWRQDIGCWPWVGRRVSTAWAGRAGSFAFSYLLVLVLAWLTLNAVYGFRGTFLPLADNVPRLADGGAAARLLGRLPTPFPGQYVFAVAQQMEHAGRGHRTYLAGHFSTRGWPYYHAVTFALKVPVAMMMMLGGTAVMSIRRRKEAQLVSTDELFLLLPAASIFLIISLVGIKSGFRHILPIMPLLFVYVSKLGLLVDEKRGWATAVLGLLCLWYVAASMAIYPHYLSYFNEIAGGPEQGYRYLVDSNIDFGQDLKGLGRYVAENDIDQIYLSFFGSADPAVYGISYSSLPSVGLRPETPDGKWWYEEGYEEVCTPVEGIVAISVSNLVGLGMKNSRCFSWLWEQEPVARIGYSINIYDTRPRGD